VIHVCVPVLKRYDLLRELLLSLEPSTVKPDRICVIDNGQSAERLKLALSVTSFPTDVYTPSKPMGVAESWNWFIQHVPEERVISNDDITFAPDSLERLCSPKADLIWAANARGESVGFSCSVLRASCVEKIGLFDETISPGYGYSEDDDYLQRREGRGTREPAAVAREVPCGVRHHKSATLQASGHEEILEHHRKFLIAQGNYARKWGVVF